jgi:hypothetical protein
VREAVCLKKTGSHLKACDLVSKDRFHNNQLAHAHISLMVINLFRRILLDSLSSMLKNKSVPVSRETNSTRDLVTHAIVCGISRQNSQLPQPVFIRPGHLNTTHPLCWTSLTPNYKRNVMTIKKKFTKATCKNCRLDGYSSWTGKAVGARISARICF